MTNRLLADLVVVAHFAFVVFAVAGGLAVLWRSWIAWLHVPAALWSGVVNLAGWLCPLTPLENVFRHRAGLAGYEGGFIEHYILPVLYPAGMTRGVALTAGVCVLAWNVIVYAVVIRRLRRRRGAG